MTGGILEPEVRQRQEVQCLVHKHTKPPLLLCHWRFALCSLRYASQRCPCMGHRATVTDIYLSSSFRVYILASSPKAAAATDLQL